jgi:sugar lactone lactonase YvrE
MLAFATGPVASASVTNGVTVAGGNLEGSAADQLFEPSGVFVDVAGSVYVADTSNNRVEKWFPGATSGITVAGGNGQGSAANQLSAPEGVFVDGKGDVYVADGNNGRVQEWAPGATSGITVAGGNGQGSAANQLGLPTSVFVDPAGDIYVADAGDDRVQEWTPGATSGVTVAGGNGQGPAANQLWGPAGVFVDGAGNVYVADTLNDRVQEWAPQATSGVTVAGTGDGFGGAGANQLNFAGLPGSVFVDGAGDVYVADTGNDRVQEWAPGATSGLTVAGGITGSAASQLASPTGLFVDGSGNVYVASQGDYNVQEWKPGPNGAPLTTVDPQSQSVITGANVTFTAGAIGKPLPAMQWQESTDGGVTWSDIAGATSPAYSLTTVPLSDNGDEFRAVFTNAAASDTTDPATLTVNTAAAPTVTTQPVSQSIPANTTATFTAAASGAPPPGVDWQYSTDGGATWNYVSRYSGGLTNSILFPSVPLSENGWEFRAVYTNNVGTVTTNVATLTVTTTPIATVVLLPSNNAVVSGVSQVLDASASSSVAVTSVRFEITGGTLTGPFIATGTPTLYGWLAEWNTTTAPNGYGNYTLQSVATDADGNTAVSAPITITVSNIPATSLLIPSMAATQSGTAALLDASASAHVRSVTFEVSGGTLTDQPVATATPTLYGWLAEWNTTTVPNGTYLLQSVALYPGSTTDSSARSLAGTSVGVFITVNNPPPTTSVLIPPDGASVSGTSSLLDAASGSAGVTSVSFELSGGTLHDQVVAAGTSSIWGWYVQWNTKTVPNGTYTLQSVASYPNGVSGTSAPITITVSN